MFLTIKLSIYIFLFSSKLRSELFEMELYLR